MRECISQGRSGKEMVRVRVIVMEVENNNKTKEKKKKKRYRHVSMLQCLAKTAQR